MRNFFCARWLWILLATGLAMTGDRLEAQGYLVSVAAAPTALAVSNSLTFTVTVTNFNTTGLAQTVTVSNTLSTGYQFISSNPTPSGTTANTVTFSVNINYGSSAQMTLTIAPTTAGRITDSVFVYDVNNNTGSGSASAQVTNPPVVADLAVGLAMPAPPVYSNDWTVYNVMVTNLGPGTVPSYLLTNSLPPGVGFQSAWPASAAPKIVGSNVIFSLGTLANGAVTNLQLTVQPTNAGTWTFRSSVSSAGVSDPNPTNNTATNTLGVIGYLAGQFLAFTNSNPATYGELYNPQNGLVEQPVTVTNIGTNAVAAVRVVVTGLSSRLFNAVGTNNGNPFVVYNATLNPNQSVSLLLQYAADAYFPFTNSQLHPFAVFRPDLTPPAAVAVSTNVNLSRIVRRPDGSMLLEWPSVTNRTYTVVYSDNVLFSNAMIAPPSVVAPANRTQWIDYGPPTTSSHPTNAPARFYRVFLNP